MKIKNNTVKEDCNYEIENKIDVKQEYLMSEAELEDVAPLDVVMKINTNTALYSECGMEIKTEFKEGDLVSDPGLQNEERIPLDVALEIQNTSSVNNNVCVMDSKIEIKEETWWKESISTEVTLHSKSPSISNVQLQKEIMACRAKGFELPESCRLYIEAKKPEPDGRYGESQAEGKIYSLHSKKFNECHEDDQHFGSALYLDKQVSDSEVTQLSCEACRKTFTDKSSFKTHLLIHEGTSSYKCDVCKNVNLSHLKVHDCILKGDKFYRSDSCQKSFTLTSLKNHQLIHKHKKILKCDICEKRFARLGHLKPHKLIHEDKKAHKCDACEKRFIHLRDLKRHKLVHEGKKPHKCDTCKKSFTQLGNLKRHTLIHEGKKPHKCDVCEKSFTHLGNLKVHKFIHEGKKPHKCNTCEKKFTLLGNLKQHKLTHEGKSIS